MKMVVFLVAGSLACVGLSGCGGGSAIDGKWCITALGTKESMTIAGGKMTADNGRSATFTVEGNKVTAKDTGTGVVQTLTLAADGKTMTVDGGFGAMMPFTRCQ